MYMYTLYAMYTYNGIRYHPLLSSQDVLPHLFRGITKGKLSFPLKDAISSVKL